ncbi:MAG: 2,3-bisphosphoglycerate-independent phosphoglycerate mutase [Thermomicrobiales bacterium]|nr:2,3-bisphosphoglycerate-independent phosphoglycerate mutase [Thermomicrobiales bacterium]
MTTPSLSPVVLVILDGWGNGQDYPGNAVLAADTPVMDRLKATYPTTALKTSGLAVGLPEGQMGNSEVGHLNIGAGFVVYQWITRIDQSIEDGSFFENRALVGSIERALANGTALHLVGLAGEGGVHSHSRHLEALLSLAGAHGLRRVYIHAITDGRDTSPTSGNGFVRDIQDHCQRLGLGRIATVSGRYYAMDRDKRWERTQLAYNTMTLGNGPTYTSAGAAIEASYRAGVTDEFIIPCSIVPPGTEPVTIGPGDEVILFNFRSDRCRQLVQALTLPDFSGFQRTSDLPSSIHVTTMTRYQEGLPVAVAFEPHDVEMPLARVISEAGLSQFHTAETEKYAHVTFFLNGGREEPFPGEDRNLVPSPKVATYDLQPEMSAIGVTDGVVAAIESGTYAFIVVNFANGDMVGHTGDFAAAVRAVETVDACLGRIIAALAKAGGSALVTADHGNSEEMIDLATGGPMTAHTLNPVPCVLVTPDSSPYRHATLRDNGILADIAPTLLQLLGLPKPPQMTQSSLVEG